MLKSENKEAEKKRIAIFASGRGSNAKAILEHFKDHDQISIALIISNNADAGVFDYCNEYGIEKMVISRQSLYQSDVLDLKLKSLDINLLVLAGFLWLIPERLVQLFPKKILNIHPALLPKYGGKGMYGSHVHQAVKDANEKESGISIHFVDENYDEGSIVFQEKVKISSHDSPEEIAAKVLKLEHFYYPKVIEKILLKLEYKK